MILLFRTDKPEAELYLYGPNHDKVGQYCWEADRKLADTLLTKITELLAQHTKKLQDLTGIIIFTGSGSFTGLRIGTSVANALAFSLDIPVVSSRGEDWINAGLTKLASTNKGDIIVPEYNGEANITLPD